MSAPTIGVLVPVRLETRFLNRGASGWALRVRVIPEAISISTRAEAPSTFELDAVEAMWREAGSANLESARGRAAWRQLAGLVGPETAAWLARTFRPTIGPRGEISITRPADVRSVMHAPKLNGLPPTMELWLARGGQAPNHAATLTPVLTDLEIDLDDPDSTEQPWWTSFAEAVRLGLAAELDLGVGVPDDIDALYVVGIGGGDPGALLTAQANSGRLGVVASGEPTTSVDGQPAASLGDVDTWRRLVPVRAAQQTGANAVRAALDAPATLAGVVGGEAHHHEVNRAVVRALWPALWGHSLGNVWDEGPRADALGVWAAENLVPEGPLPALRIDNHPYGLLPATSLRGWQQDDGDPPIEQQLVPLVAALVDEWAATAERAGAASSNALATLVRNPGATSYAWRWMMPTELASALSFRHGDPIARTSIDGWWDRVAAPAARLSPDSPPARRLVATGWAEEVGLELAQPRRPSGDVDFATSLSQLADATVADLISAGPTSSGAPGDPVWGRSLLTELARHSLLSSAATVARNVAGQPRALVEPVSVDAQRATATETWAARLQPVDLTRQGDAAVTVHLNVREGLRSLATLPADDVDRALRAALDTAIDRVDPWATAIAWRRLQSLADAPRSLGVYSWVDAPRPRASIPDHRFVLAPSQDQAAVAAMLRDRAIHDPDASAWDIDLTSDAVRGALRLAGEIREGSHPSESLGRMVERIVGRLSVIDSLRDAFPMTPAFDFRRLRVRRVCNGVAVLEAATSRPDDVRQLGVTSTQVAALVELAKAVDALADLHVVEAALGVVKRRTSLVSSAAAAAAGEAPPPQFTAPTTPRRGIAVESVVIVALPDAPNPGGRSPSPAAVADPAVAAFLDARGGDPSGPLWTWTRLDDEGREAGPVTLADLGLRPADTVGLGVANLRDTVLAVSGAVRLRDGGPSGPTVVRTWAAALAGVPAVAADVGSTPDSGTTGPELATRYARLHSAATDAAADARSAAATGTDQQRRRALGRLARWGITPMSADQAGGTSLADRLAGAVDVLERRVAALPTELANATVGELTEAMTALVSPEVGYPIFARLPVAAFAGSRADRVQPGPAPRLDPEWLETVAAVRPVLARLEAAQLGERTRSSGGSPLRAWTNQRDDPWQTAAVQAGAGSSRLVATFTPMSTLPAIVTTTSAGRVAAAVVDRFAEMIPATEHVAAVAFPHDLPVARAPQAVVLAVPPVVDEELSAEVMVDIVAGVRDLAHARMTTAAAVGAAANQLHLVALPATGRAGVQFGGRR